MKVIFQKTGERRYAVLIEREGFSDLEMNPAPGFDPLMPHDLLHFLVEQELNLKNGIYGQIAGGGTAGTFHVKSSDKSNDRDDSRERRKTAQRGKKLLKNGLDDCSRSERATYVCMFEWLSHSPDAKLKAKAAEMKVSIESTFKQMSENERANINKKLARIRDRMDDLSERWSKLKTGESVSLDW